MWRYKRFLQGKERGKMGISDLFKISEFKSEIEHLKVENQRLFNDNCYMNSLLTPEMKQSRDLNSLICELENKKAALLNDISNIQQDISRRVSNINNLDNEINLRKEEIIELDEKILLQDFGLYTPVYNLMTSEAYKERLTLIRQKQKNMIKNDTACVYPTTFTLDGSLSKGKKMMKDNVKQILRSFNNECDTVIDKVKFNNIESIRKKIQKSFNDLNRMNSSFRLSIVDSYLSLKLEELNLCYEYSVKKQEEKEEQKRIREQLREEARLQKELEEARKNIEKEKKHYENVLKSIETQIASTNDSDKAELEAKKMEILNQLNEIVKSIKNIDYREANKRAGYVYIISNIGAFGENVYKIGMTRRLDPQDRVDELGDASVPFNFDVHAMIFSDDAPALEAALHKAFEDRKLNMVNTRREFFNVTLDEIKDVVRRNFDKTVEFIDVPDAEQFRISQEMKQKQ